MINPLVVKIGFGGAVVTGTGTVGIVYKNQIKDFFVKHFSAATSTYVIMKTSSNSDSGIEKQLYESGNKNFKCVISNNDKKNDDFTCEIFLINEPTSGKLNNLDDIQKSNKEATKEKISSDGFFKLIISDSSFGEKTWDGTQTIDVVSKDELKDDKTNKKYGSFSIQYKLNNSDIEGKTNLIIGKITAKSVNSDLSESVNFHCSLTGENSKSACSLFKIATPPTLTKDVLLTGITDASKTANDYAVNNWYVIDLKRTDNKKNISELKTQNIIVVNQGTNTSPVATFEFQAALSNTDGAFSTSNFSKIIFI